MSGWVDINSHGSVNIPRIYCDFIQYAKAIDYVKFYYVKKYL